MSDTLCVSLTEFLDRPSVNFSLIPKADLDLDSWPLLHSKAFKVIAHFVFENDYWQQSPKDKQSTIYTQDFLLNCGHLYLVAISLIGAYW